MDGFLFAHKSPDWRALEGVHDVSPEKNTKNADRLFSLEGLENATNEKWLRKLWRVDMK